MMTRFRFFAVATTFTAVLAAGVAFAQGPGLAGRGGRGPGGPGFGRGGGLPLRAVSLTEAQQNQIRELTKQSFEQNRAAAERLRTAMDAQRKAVQTIPVDEQLIRSTTQQLAEAQTEVLLHQAQLQAEIFSLLTPEQQAEVAKLRAQREARVQEQRNRRQGSQPSQPQG